MENPQAIRSLNMDQALFAYQMIWESRSVAAIRELCLVDRFFLLVYVLGRHDCIHPWIYARCREVEDKPDGCLDLWSRYHYKSTIITFAGTIQEILRNQEITIAIFSKNDQIAKDFLKQVKIELEQNKMLIRCFPEVLWEKPDRESTSWSMDGITVRRKGNPKECTLEAYGILNAMPTGKHFGLCIYDDLVDADATTNPDMIRKVTERWELSLSLSNTRDPRRWYVGTRYHIFDTYAEIIRRGGVFVRINLCIGEDGRPVLMKPAVYAAARAEMGPRTWAAQMLQNPVGEGNAYFRSSWIVRYDRVPDRANMNVYIVVDPASSKKQRADSSVFLVLGLREDGNYYLLDARCDKLNLGQRADVLFELHRRWRPICVGYEKYGMQSDVDYLKERMSKTGYHFRVMELGGAVSKPERIARLIPYHEQGRFVYPHALEFIDSEGIARDFMEEFVRLEFSCYPLAQHDDMLDCLARILDKDFGAEFPAPPNHNVLAASTPRNDMPF